MGWTEACVLTFRLLKCTIIMSESESRSVVSDSLRPHGLVHGILQARVLERVAFPFSRGSSQPRDQTQVSCIAGRFFTSWATREALTTCNFKGDEEESTRPSFLSVHYVLRMVCTFSISQHTCETDLSDSHFPYSKLRVNKLFQGKWPPIHLHILEST